MTLARLAPALPTENRRPWGFAASMALHVAAVAIVVWFTARIPTHDGSAGPSYDLVFETPAERASGQTLPPSQQAEVPAPEDAPVGMPTPPPMAIPAPDASGTAQPEAANPAPAPEASAAPPAPEASAAPPAPEASAAPPPPPPARTAMSSPAQSPPAPAIPAPMPDLVEPVAPASSGAEVRLQPPTPEQAPLAAEPIMPQPPPPLPPLPQRLPVPPRAVSRTVPGSLANPMDLSLGPIAPRPAARAARGIDLSMGMAPRGPSRSDPYAQIRAANASEDWNRSLRRYWEQHRYYPQHAAAEGEQGQVTIELTVNRYGAVENVRVLSTSGSQWLDMAAVGTFRGGKLRPFTDEMPQERITFSVPITYYLVR